VENLSETFSVPVRIGVEDGRYHAQARY